MPAISKSPLPSPVDSAPLHGDPNGAPEPLTLSPSKAADFLGIGRTKMLHLIRSGRVEARTLDGRIRVSVASLRAFHDALPVYSVGSAPEHAS